MRQAQQPEVLGVRGHAGWLLAAVRGALEEALALVLPVVCAGCDAPDTPLCELCAASLRPVLTHRTGMVPIWSGLVFDAVPARVMRALKEAGRTGLARPLAPALRAAVEAAMVGQVAGDPPVVVVPLPTSRGAYRRRGYRVVELLARRAGLPFVRALAVSRATADQRGLGRAARAANVALSLYVPARLVVQVKGVRVVVIDDVVTTGATLNDAVRALTDAGAEVIGAATVAGTLRHDGRV